MKLYYITGEKRELLLESDDERILRKEMYRYIHEVLKFDSHYQREWTVPPNETYIDYGSHENFFVISK